MFKRLRRGLEKLGILKAKPTPSPRPQKPKPTPKSIPVVTRPPTPSLKRNRVRDHILELFPWGKKKNIDYRLRFMSPDELTWTFYAKANAIRDKAKLAPDREDDDGELLNPWWYK